VVGNVEAYTRVVEQTYRSLWQRNAANPPAYG
jgi:hypothetical protein